MNSSTVRITGRIGCKQSYELRNFLQRSSVEFEWVALTTDDEARKLPGISALSDRRLPICEFPGGIKMFNPTVRDIAERMGLLAKPKLLEYDLSIYGAGPAGLSAAVHAAADGLKTIIIEREAIGGQTGSSARIENYLGFPDGISGSELADRGRQQAVKFGCEILQLREGIFAEYHNGNIWVTLNDGSKIIAKSNICATGVEYRKLDLPNEDQFLGNGLYYGAGSSEMSRLDGKVVYVVGAANSAGQAAMQLATRASQVVMLVRGLSLAGQMSDYLRTRVTTHPAIKIEYNVEVSGITGDTTLQEITIRERSTGDERICASNDLFVCIGGLPNTEWARDLPILRDAGGFILTGHDMFTGDNRPKEWPLRRDPFFLETSVPGSFAAGDVRANSVKRFASAVGEGTMAIKFVEAYLTQRGLTRT